MKNQMRWTAGLLAAAVAAGSILYTPALPVRAKAPYDTHWNEQYSWMATMTEALQKNTDATAVYREIRLALRYLPEDNPNGEDSNVSGNIGAYWEVSRDFTFYKVKRNDKHNFSAHIEYDGGLSQVAGAFQQAMLVGPAWNWHSADFKKTFTLQVMYKQFFNSTDVTGTGIHDAHPSFQITPIWNITFANDLCTFSGFADLWYGWGSNFTADDGQKKGLVFLTEPQFWFHIVNKGKTSNRLSVGTEVEISNNFIYATPYGMNTNKTFFINPTIALKWDI